MNHMLTEQIAKLRLTTFGEALTRQEAQPQQYNDLSFHERISLLFDEELSNREQCKVKRLVK